MPPAPTSDLRQTNYMGKLLKNISSSSKMASLQLPPSASQNHCQKRADFNAFNLICRRGSKASASLMFPGRTALIKHFSPWITDKECLRLARSSLWKIDKTWQDPLWKQGRASRGYDHCLISTSTCCEGKADPWKAYRSKLACPNLQGQIQT